MEIIKALVVKELMDGKGQRMAYAEHGTESIGARAQMRFLTKKFESMAFFLQRIRGGISRAVHLKFIGLHLHCLSFSLRGDERALHMDA